MRRKPGNLSPRLRTSPISVLHGQLKTYVKLSRNTPAAVSSTPPRRRMPLRSSFMYGKRTRGRLVEGRPAITPRDIGKWSLEYRSLDRRAQNLNLSNLPIEISHTEFQSRHPICKRMPASHLRQAKYEHPSPEGGSAHLRQFIQKAADSATKSTSWHGLGPHPLSKPVPPANLPAASNYCLRHSSITSVEWKAPIGNKFILPPSYRKTDRTPLVVWEINHRSRSTAASRTSPNTSIADSPKPKTPRRRVASPSASPAPFSSIVKEKARIQKRISSPQRVRTQPLPPE